MQMWLTPSSKCDYCRQRLSRNKVCEDIVACILYHAALQQSSYLNSSKFKKNWGTRNFSPFSVWNFPDITIYPSWKEGYTFSEITNNSHLWDLLRALRQIHVFIITGMVVIGRHTRSLKCVAAILASNWLGCRKAKNTTPTSAACVDIWRIQYSLLRNWNLRQQWLFPSNWRICRTAKDTTTIVVLKSSKLEHFFLSSPLIVRQSVAW